VYLHEMPGGQFTNLKEQARSLGLETRWHEVASAYRDANLLFGDIVKVTPSSKVVGDMALMMVAQGLALEDVVDPAREIAFPASVVEMIRGDLGQPIGGWPADIQHKVLGDTAPITVRPASLLGASDLAAERAQAERACGRKVSDTEFASYLMYPKVFLAFAAAHRTYGPVSRLPTSVFFYGMEPGQEINVDIEQGKALVIRMTAVGEIEDDGSVRVFFELNGQPRVIAVANRKVASARPGKPFADEGNETHLAAPMPGLVVAINVKEGQQVHEGEPILTLEAMKMETSISARFAGSVAKVHANVGDLVEAKQLLVNIERS
jgi:pyruvate carboxylase